MKTFRDKPHSVITFNYHHQGKTHLAITIMAMFSFTKKNEFLRYAEFWKVVKKSFHSSQGDFLDLYLPKKRAEYLVMGSCYSYDNTTRQSVVKVTLDNMQKELVVYGERHWSEMASEHHPSRPACFTRVPVTAHNAYGGPGHPVNPDGEGIISHSDTLNTVKLPQVELPGKLIKETNDTAYPALLLPLSPTCQYQINKLGTFNQDWLLNESPYYPADIDWSYFNRAAADQQRDQYFKGDELFSFTNMHPEQPLINSQLPGMRVRCFFKRMNDTDLNELKLQLDTIWLLPDEEKGILIWHGLIDTQDIAANDLDYIYTVSELMSEPPKDIDHYIKVRNKKSNKSSAVQAAEAPAEIKTPPSYQDSLVPLPLPSIQNQQLQKQNSQRNLEALKQQIINSPLSEQEQQIAIKKLEYLKQQMEQLDKTSNALLFRSRHVNQSSFTREDIIAGYQKKKSFLDENLAGIDLSDLDLSGINLSGCNLSHCNLTRTHLNYANLSQTTFIESTFSETMLIGANGSNTLIRNAVLKKTNFQECQLPYALIENCSIEESNFSMAFLNYAKFKKCQSTASLFVGLKANFMVITECSFEQCNFSEARLKLAHITQGSWININLTKADLSQAIWDQSTLSNVIAARVIAPNLSMKDCTIDHAILDECQLDRLSFKGTRISNSTFTKSSLPGINLQNAQLMQINFQHCVISNIRANHGTKIFESTFEHCTLSNAAFLGGHYEKVAITASDLHASQLINTTWKHSNFSQCHAKKLRMVNCTIDSCAYGDINFFQGIFHSSSFSDSTFNHCNLYSVGFIDCQRQRVTIKDCLVKNASVEPVIPEEPS